MKQDANYIQDALRFERMAAIERDPTLKSELEKQAAAYRKLAEAPQKHQATIN